MDEASELRVDPLLADLRAAAAGLAEAAGAGLDQVALLSDEDLLSAVDMVMAAQAQVIALRTSLLSHAEALGCGERGASDVGGGGASRGP